MPIQSRHIEHMHEGVWLKMIFDKMTATMYENLDNFSLIWLLYIHR